MNKKCQEKKMQKNNHISNSDNFFNNLSSAFTITHSEV